MRWIIFLLFSMSAFSQPQPSLSEEWDDTDRPIVTPEQLQKEEEVARNCLIQSEQAAWLQLDLDAQKQAGFEIIQQNQILQMKISKARMSFRQSEFKEAKKLFQDAITYAYWINRYDLVADLQQNLADVQNIINEQRSLTRNVIECFFLD